MQAFLGYHVNSVALRVCTCKKFLLFKISFKNRSNEQMLVIQNSNEFSMEAANTGCLYDTWNIVL